MSLQPSLAGRRRRWLERALWATLAISLAAAFVSTGLKEHPPARTLRSYLPAPPDVGFAFTGILLARRPSHLTAP